MSDSRNRLTAELIVKRWNELLTSEGALHGVLGYANELMDFIEDELDRRDNAAKKAISEATDDKQTE